MVRMMRKMIDPMVTTINACSPGISYHLGMV